MAPNFFTEQEKAVLASAWISAHNLIGEPTEEEENEFEKYMATCRLYRLHESILTMILRGEFTVKGLDGADILLEESSDSYKGKLDNILETVEDEP